MSSLYATEAESVQSSVSRKEIPNTVSCREQDELKSDGVFLILKRCIKINLQTHVMTITSRMTKDKTIQLGRYL